MTSWGMTNINEWLSANSASCERIIPKSDFPKQTPYKKEGKDAFTIQRNISRLKG